LARTTKRQQEIPLWDRYFILLWLAGKGKQKRGNEVYPAPFLFAATRVASTNMAVTALSNAQPAGLPLHREGTFVAAINI
jgi:hypothetical protein